MVFFSCFFTYMLRSNMSINLLAMVQPLSTKNENGTFIEPPDVCPIYAKNVRPDIMIISQLKYGQRYSWSAYDQSLLLGSFFWGYTIASIPCGLLSARTSSRMLLTYSFLLCAFLTALGPLGASLSYWMLFSLRMLLGIFSVYDSLNSLDCHHSCCDSCL